MHVDVTARGEVPRAVQDVARDKLGRLDEVVKGPVLHARAVLTQERNPRLERPARAEAELNLQGRTVRARVAAPAMDAAVDELAEHLHRQLRRYVDRLADRQRVAAEAPPGEWRHGSWSPPAPGYFPRPPDEREIVRRKSFAAGPMSVAEAVADMQVLDHDFFLFRDADAHAEAVLYRREDGRLGLIEPPDVELTAPENGPVREPSRFTEPIELATAVAEMNELDHRFLFFTDADTGRGNVIYLRYDGHYGLIEAA